MLLKKFSRATLDVNCYVVADEQSREAAIIDPGYYHPQLSKYLAEQGLTAKYMVLTHGHGDHFCGVPSYRKKYPDSIVVAHAAEQMLLGNGAINFSEEVFGRAITIQPDLFVREGDSLALGSLSLQVLETPGHSPGSISLYLRDESASPPKGYLFSGDTLLRRSVGRCDLPGGSSQQLLRVIRQKLFAFADDTIVLPGHMAETTIGYEKQNNPFLQP